MIYLRFWDFVELARWAQPDFSLLFCRLERSFRLSYPAGKELGKRSPMGYMGCQGNGQWPITVIQARGSDLLFNERMLTFWLQSVLKKYSPKLKIGEIGEKAKL